MKFKSTLKGERLILKRTKPGKYMAKKMFDLIDQNREHLRPWFPWIDGTKTIEDIVQYLCNKETMFIKKEKIAYGIYLDSKYIGNISMFDINWTHKSGEIGYWIDAKYQGKGYMTEAIKILEKYFFEDYQLHRIVIRCEDHNIPSNQIAKKCQYTPEGRLRKAVYNHFIHDYTDLMVYAKLREDYEGKTLSLGQWLDQKLPDTKNYKTRLTNVLVELLQPFERRASNSTYNQHINTYAKNVIYEIKFDDIKSLSKKKIISGRNLGKNSYELLFKLLEQDGIILQDK